MVLIDLRDRYRSEASGVYYHAATPHTGRDGYDICEWIGTQPWSNGKVGTVGSSYAAITQVRTALEAPPHLTAIWPDVVPTNNFQNQCREGGAMPQHMFWALFLHAQDAQEVRDDWSKAGEVWDDLKNLRQLFRATPWTRGQTPLRTCRRSKTRCSTTTSAAPTTSGGTGSAQLHALLGPACRHPGHVLDRLVRPVPDRRHRVLRRDGREEHAPRGSSSGRGTTSACAATPRTAARSTSACRASGACSATSRNSATASIAGCRTTPTASRGRGAGADLRDGRRLGPQDGRRQARPRRPLARGAGVAARARRRSRRSTSTATVRSRRGAGSGAPPRKFTFDPVHPVPTSAASTARSASCRPKGRGWSRPGRGS